MKIDFVSGKMNLSKFEVLTEGVKKLNVLVNMINPLQNVVCEQPQTNRFSQFHLFARKVPLMAANRYCQPI